MLILKGLLIGTGLFLIYSFAYLRHLTRPVGQNTTGITSISLAGLQVLTIENPLYWAALIGMLFLSCITVLLWHRSSLW